MKPSSAITITSLFFSLIAAIPLEKRELIVVTKTKEEIEWVDVTTTIYVEATPIADTPAPAVKAEPTPEIPKVKPGKGVSFLAKEPAKDPEPVVEPAKTVVAPAPIQTPSSPPSPPPAPAVTPPTAPAPAPPVEEKAAPAPAPVSETPPAPKPVAAKTAEAPAPKSSSSSSSVGSNSGLPTSGSPSTGKITYYDVHKGDYGYCGDNTVEGESENIVALPVSILDAHGEGLCGKSITISYNGAETSAKVYDKCPSCDATHIDVSRAAFKAVDPSYETHGTVEVDWWFN
ncbi:MAG: hypothetical protein M1825_000817 [Sarcosagium campestre]|nr:MAG: hypothetical protein M1825_000817 [Sarcosagium campestre]